ncbi:MAG: HAMP domain-containing histidine kinase [Gammaproteobacteria bacterium]|nr:HAMP domain-containing histidine kinase [Gammaproteobacteria bacterium]
MIKKLRFKFILVSLLSILLVLSITIGSINIYNYVRMKNEIHQNLISIVERGDEEFPRMDEAPDSNRPMDMGGGFMRGSFFTVSYNSDGTVASSNFDHIFFISEEDGISLASDVYSSNKTEGKTDNMYYLKMEKDGLTIIAFVDAKDRTNQFNSFLVSSILVSSISYLVLALLIVLSSKVVFKVSEESYKKQKAFITNASHELKTPLTIINTDIELIEMDNGSSEWTTSVKDQVSRLTTMTNQLVILSRLDEGELSKYPFEDFSLSDLAHEAVESFASSFKKEGLTLSTSIEDDLIINANKYLIDELLFILLDNALKYTAPNGTVGINIYKDSKNKVNISIYNDIEEDNELDVNQLFERFYRSPNAKKNGSGIGLSIAQEIINLHKAQIKVTKENNILKFNISF